MLAATTRRRSARLGSHRQQGGNEAVEIKLLAADAHHPRRMGTAARTSPLSLAVAASHDLRRRPRAALAGALAAGKSLSRQCLGDRGRA
jgi:hypothetical protein